MPQLHGHLGFMPCRDLFLYLGNRKMSGRLDVRRGGVRKSLSVEEGAATSAASNDPREYLGQVLINAGHLSEEIDLALRGLNSRDSAEAVRAMFERETPQFTGE